jgi:hypothetical protein
MPARKDQSSAGPFHVSLLLRSVKNVGIAQRKHRVNQKPRLNHRQRRHKQVQSAGLLELLVFPENQNHRKQAHARGDDDEGENEGPA